MAATKTVSLDPSLPWNGYRAVSYQGGTPTRYDYFPPGSTTISQLQASINSTGTVICAPDISMDASFHFDTNVWADASGTSAAICTVDSTFYGDSTTIGNAGDTVLFSGMLVSNNLAAPYSNSIIAFIKDYDSGWGLQGISSVSLGTFTNGQTFTLSRSIAITGDHIQWGFEWSGPAARSNNVAGLGSSVVRPLPIPRGAVTPWTAYEAENMTYTGQLLGPSYAGHDVASESSGRKCIRLSATGQYAQFTALSNATALVVRYSVPDTADGAGTDYSLGLYKNGTFVGRLSMTSRYSWLYGAYPFTNRPSDGLPRNFFDETRTNGLSINAGDLLKLQKDAADTATWYDIDLVDLESVDAPLVAPANSLSITSYGAVGDGATDSTTALQNCIALAQAQGKTVWIPAGTWLITSNINLPSNTTLQGAGMWYTKLVGSSPLYNTPSRRVSLNGNGSSIHLTDFAIVGCLNYRNDNEPNDGLGGSYGTSSSISRVWVEHTKTGAWLVNSSGLVVDGCRFRDTIADGINLCVGMRGTLVTNCTARGTGDDCFAIWPAAYISPAYAPGLNVITHCTGQTPFLANGGAIYGAESNRIEDCVFQDIPYQSGVLISTTFPVSSNFTGTTVVQRCDLNRCGGTPVEPAGGLQICLQFRPISGLDLNNLNISNSVTYGMSIIYGGGPLSNSVMTSVNIPNYGIGGSGAHALWARGDARGSLTVNNSSIVEYQDDSVNFDFFFSPPPPQRILRLSTSGGTNLTLTYFTAPWSTYHVESSPTLTPASWTMVPGSTTNATGRAVTFTTPFQPGSLSRFYRTVSP
jgi:hypothetical protein